MNYRKVKSELSCVRHISRDFSPFVKTFAGNCDLNQDTVLELLSAKPYGISSRTQSVFSRLPLDFNCIPQTFSIVVFSPCEIGFTQQGVSFGDYISHVEQFGFQTIPHELSVISRLCYVDQPEKELILFASRPLTECDGFQVLFDMSHVCDRLYFGVSAGSELSQYKPTQKIAFLVPEAPSV